MKKRVLKDWVAESMLIANFVLLALVVSFKDGVSIAIIFFSAIIVAIITFINITILSKYSRLFK